MTIPPPAGKAHQGTTPAAGRATPDLDRACVADVMRAGVISCARETTLRIAARIMATYQVHCVLVSGVVGRSGEDSGWGMVSDFDLVRAIAAGGDPEQPVENVVSRPLHTIRPQVGVQQAAELMSAREITHLVVIDEELGEPMGLVSSLDVAALLARS